jgi:hydrogenase expression/formation protein HypE
MSVREGLEFGSEIRSDCAPLNGLVEALFEVVPDIHMLRDPTRGGVAATLNEIAKSSGTGIEIVERSVPVPDDVRAACGFLGLDPLYVANEGRFIAIVPPEAADTTLALLRRLDPAASRIGTALGPASPGEALLDTIGGRRPLDLLSGEQLPRIC